MKKIKNLQIKRPLSLLLAFGMLACARPVAVCNRAQALTEGSVNLDKTFFAFNTELDSTWGDVSVDTTTGDVSTSGGTGQKLFFLANFKEKDKSPDKREGTVGSTYIPWYICSRLNSPTNALTAGNIATSPANTNALVLYAAEEIGCMPFHDSTTPSNNWNTSDIKTALNDPEKWEFQSERFQKGELNIISDSVVKVLPYGSNTQTIIDAAKFFLPCGALPLPVQRDTEPIYNIKESGFISWGEDDAVAAPMGVNFALVANEYEKTLIPMKYWGSDINWLRSASQTNNKDVLVSDSKVGVISNPANIAYRRDAETPICVKPACKIDLDSVEFASAAVSVSILMFDFLKKEDENIGLDELPLFFILDPELPEDTPPEKGEPGQNRFLTKSNITAGCLIGTANETGMLLRFASDDVHEPTVTADTITGTAGETITIQGFTNGTNWSYSKKINKDASGRESQITLDDVNNVGIEVEAFSDQNKLTSFEKVTVWGEKMGTGDQEGLLLTSATPKDNTPEPPTPGNPNPNEPGNGGNKPNAPGNGVTSPPTGDNLQTWLWFGVAGITGFASWYVSMRKRRRRA